jgi:hypothetical protein
MNLTRVSYRLHLYSRKAVQASLVLLLAVAAFLTAAAQHRFSHKLRATGVLELVSDSSGAHYRLTPIIVLDGGRFHDASMYATTPQPMALANGVVYEAQKNGVPVGTLTITRSEEKNGVWVAGGSWLLAPKPRPPSAPGATPAANPGDERPRIHHGDGADSSSSPPAPSSTTSAPPTTPAAVPAPAPAPSEPQEEDPNRPSLRHRTIVQQKQEAENPALRPSPTQSAAAATASHAPLQGAPIMVAVSDAQFTETRSYEFPWKPEEKPPVEAKMRKLALDQLPAEKPALTDSALKNVTIRSFDLDLTNDAVVVLTAEVAPAPPPPAPRRAKGAKSTKAAEVPVPAKPAARFLTLIARFDLDGNPAKLLVNVTDASRLDVVPRLDLIDAVDVDGDGVAELLFCEYGFNQKGYIIYSVGHGVLNKVFEGATQPLR